MDNQTLIGLDTFFATAIPYIVSFIKKDHYPHGMYSTREDKERLNNGN